jgi:hypothetical protein
MEDPEQNETTFEELDARLTSLCGEALKTLLRSAAARSGGGLAERIATLQEARLVIHANGNLLQVDLVAPAANGGAELLLGLTAVAEEQACALH